tara:strand:+ start:4029 stop:4277 length:249 start_codon:yes stop_codon:yes gene_type:complete
MRNKKLVLEQEVNEHNVTALPEKYRKNYAGFGRKKGQTIMYFNKNKQQVIDACKRERIKDFSLIYIYPNGGVIYLDPKSKFS